MRVPQARSTQPAEQPIKTLSTTPPFTTGTSTQRSPDNQSCVASRATTSVAGNNAP